jgi:hypothetical protein
VVSGSWSNKGPRMPESAFFADKSPVLGDKRAWVPVASRLPLLVALAISLVLIGTHVEVAPPAAVLEAALAADTGITEPESVYVRRNGLNYSVTLIGPHLSLAREVATVGVSRTGEVLAVRLTLGDPRPAYRTLLWLGIVGAPASLLGLFGQWRIEKTKRHSR